jgi:hypothetical protein
VDEVADGLRFIGEAPLADQGNPRIEIPSDQHDPLLCLHHGSAGMAEIIIGIDDDAHAGCIDGRQTRRIV